MARKRQHHYVQARYLDGFVIEPHGMLWCYGRKRLSPYSALPDNLAHQRDFYALPNSITGEDLEEFLEKFVETPGLTALRTLVDTKNVPLLTDRVHLAKHIAFQETRVPYMRDRVKMQMLHEARDMVRRFRETGGTNAEHHVFATVNGQPVVRSAPVIISRDEAEEYLREIEANPKTFDLEMMVEMATDATHFLAQMNWDVLLAPTGSNFISSDCPVFRMFSDESDPNDAFLRPDCKIVCPLTKSALLVMKHDMDFLAAIVSGKSQSVEKKLPSTAFIEITDQEVSFYNWANAENANLWCFSGSKSEWIAQAMKGRSKRAELHLFAEKHMTGGRWIRTVEPPSKGD